MEKLVFGNPKVKERRFLYTPSAWRWEDDRRPAIERAASVGEVRSRLPAEFQERLARVVPPGTVDRVLSGMGSRRRTTLRVNALKGDARSLLREFHGMAVKVERAQWYGDAFVLQEAHEREAQGWAAYREGRIYLQTLSSMVPPLVLNPKPGEEILDIAAAPGSKTTQMAALMEDRGRILANELDGIRAERLAYNVRLQGCTCVEVLRGPGEKMGTGFPGRFDRILVDVPCSGEGQFHVSSPMSFRKWSPRLVTQCQRVQRRLLASACRALKPGGVLVYSTCTLNTDENETIVSEALRDLPLTVEPITLAIHGLLPGITAGFPPGLRGAIRILPSQDWEGFFICRMRKKGA